MCVDSSLMCSFKILKPADRKSKSLMPGLRPNTPIKKWVYEDFKLMIND